MFDIVVLGAGIVGLTVANCLAGKNFSVALIEKRTCLTPVSVAVADPRYSAIAQQSVELFRELGLWDCILENASSYQKMIVWDADGPGNIHFDAKILPVDALGYVVANSVLTKTLAEATVQNSNITFLSGVAPTAINFNQQAAMITLDTKEVVKAKLVIAADGQSSWLRKTVGIEVDERDYQQSALIAKVVTECRHEETAWQRFLADGPLAFLPLRDPYESAIVWTAKPASIKKWLCMPELEFCEVLAHGLDYQLGSILQVSERHAFPLKSLHAKRYVQERVVLMGEALHVIHPLAGQGLNLSLADVRVLTDVLQQALHKQQDIGNFLILRKFERARKIKVWRTLKAMDAVNRWFSSEVSWRVGLRNLGLTVFDKSAFLKRRLILAAMGLL